MKALIASGGSGGHIFPALSFAKELSRRGAEIIFVASDRRLDKKVLRHAPYAKIFFPANPMPYGFGFSVFIFLVKLITDAARSFYLLIRYRPDIVIGFGGYTAGAIVFLAKWTGIKTVIHEQNAVPGRANAFLDRFVDTVAVSFPGSGAYFKNKRITFTGNPLREESLAECRGRAMEKFGLDNGKFTVLIMGGSQGASSLNILASKALADLPGAQKEKIQVIHITGVKDIEIFRGFYAGCGISGRAFEFIDNINEAYSASDLAISRSGAAAVFELAAFAKPMILIPYPARKNNQRYNAEFFAKKGAAIFKDEAGLDPRALGGLILELANKPEKRRELSENAKRLSVTDGARRLAELVLEF